MKEYQTGLILVHGIQGSPRQFEFLLKTLPDSVYTQNILLPGHGASVREFRKSGRRPWLAAVRRATQEAQAHCEKLFFVGHSMGCLLGLTVASELPGCYAGMLLLCCPFSIHPTLRYIKNGYLAAKTKGNSADPLIHALWASNSVKADHPWDYLTCAHPYMELLRLIRETRSLPATNAQMQFFFAKQDEIVGGRAIKIAKEKYDSEIALLKDCSHGWFTDEAKAEIADCLSNMIG